MKDYYYILGVRKNCTPDEIKSAFRKLSMKFHPDKNSGEKFFEERFIEIREAFEVLSNPETRRDYDAKDRNPNTANDDFLRSFEEAVRQKYEAEYRKKEEKFKKQQTETAKQDSRKTRPPGKDNPSSSSTSVSPDNEIFSIVIVMVVIFFIIVAISSNKKEQQYYNPVKDKTSLDFSDVVRDSNAVDSFATVIEPDKPFNTTDIILHQANKETISLASFLKADSTSRSDSTSGSDIADKSYSFIDLNNDLIPELITQYYTGGAHCCYVNVIYVQNADKEYESILEYTGGINIKKDVITLSFYERLGYFATCYACVFEQELPYSILPEIKLLFQNNEIRLADTDTAVNSMVIDNLAFLKARLPARLDENGFDDGYRKAYAHNLVTFYYNNQQDLKMTKNVFDAYYSQPDKDAIWRDIYMKLQPLRSLIGG